MKIPFTTCKRNFNIFHLILTFFSCVSIFTKNQGTKSEEVSVKIVKIPFTSCERNFNTFHLILAFFLVFFKFYKESRNKTGTKSRGVSSTMKV